MLRAVRADASIRFSSLTIRQRRKQQTIASRTRSAFNNSDRHTSGSSCLANWRVPATQETEEVEPVPSGEVAEGNSKAAEGNSKAAQLLGIRGASETENIWKIRLQLTKPVTWVPLIWGVICGAAASGNYVWSVENVAKSITTMILAAPLLTGASEVGKLDKVRVLCVGYTQTMNDWYDREIDAINEPYRPIPSGAISEKEVIVQIWTLLLGGFAVAYGLDVWSDHDIPTVSALAIFGALISYIYSAPPLKLKQSGWLGNYALGSSYIALPWWAGQAVFGTLTIDVMIFTILYSIAGLGIAIVNDFKSIEGDRELGLQSLPVAFGIDTAKWICVGSIDLTQIAVALYLYFGLEEKTNALILSGLILPQLFFQFRFFLPDPVKNDVRYQAISQPFFIFGLLTTALAFGHRAAV